MPVLVILGVFLAAALIGLLFVANRARPTPAPAARRATDGGYVPLYGDGGTSTSSADCADSSSAGGDCSGGGDGGGGGGD